MPSYKVPRNDSENESISMPDLPMTGLDRYEREIRMPVDETILNCCEVGEVATFHITGILTAKTDRSTSEGNFERSITLDAMTIAMPDGRQMDDQEEMVNAFEKGFSRSKPL